MRRALLEAMRRGEFPDGRLPPEARLAGDLGVSRATIRAALQSLAEDGIVSRRRRLGTVVNPGVLRGTVPLNRFASFRDLVEQSGYACTVETLAHKTMVPRAEVAEVIGVPTGEPCLVVDRLLRADGEPVITVTDALALEVVTTQLGELRAEESTFAFIAANTATRVDHSQVEIVPSVAADGRPDNLGLPAGTPYAELREVLFAPRGDVVAFSRIAVDVRRIRLTLARRDV